MSISTKASRQRPAFAVGPQHAPKRRVTQGAINKMAELRQQGVSYQEIGARLGCSERTARRYVGNVQPQLQLPEALPEPEEQDPEEMRRWLARWYSLKLYNSKDYPPPRLSVTWMAEATRTLNEELAEVPALILDLMMKDPALRMRFLREKLALLYGSYRGWVNFEMEFGFLDLEPAAATWKPLRDCPPATEEDLEALGDFEF